MHRLCGNSCQTCSPKDSSLQSTHRKGAKRTFRTNVNCESRDTDKKRGSGARAFINTLQGPEDVISFPPQQAPWARGSLHGLHALWVGGWIDGWMDGWIDRQTDRQAGRQADRLTQTERPTDLLSDQTIVRSIDRIDRLMD